MMQMHTFLHARFPVADSALHEPRCTSVALVSLSAWMGVQGEAQVVVKGPEGLQHHPLDTDLVTLTSALAAKDFPGYARHMVGLDHLIPVLS